MEHQQTQLLERLAVLRRSVRRRLLTFGVSTVLGSICLYLLLAIALDRLLRFPAAFRLAILVLFFPLVLGFVWYWIIRPLRVPLSVEQLARRIEKRFPQCEDRLISAVSFSTNGERDVHPLAQRVIDEAFNATRTIRFHSILAKRPLATRLVLGLISVFFLVAALVRSPEWISLGAHRLTYPFRTIEWPRTVQIVPVGSRQTIAIGDSVTLRTRIAKGDKERLRCLLYYQIQTQSQTQGRGPDRESSVQSVVMERNADGEYVTALDNVTQSISYWYKAGDDTTLDEPGIVEVVPRPEVVQALAEVTPPSYAASSWIEVHELADQPLNVSFGGRVKLKVQTSKPIRISQAGDAETPQSNGLQPAENSDLYQPTAYVELSDGKTFPLEADARVPDRMEAEFEVLENLEFYIRLRDEHDLANKDTKRYKIAAVADAPPTIAILEPKGYGDATPSGGLFIVARAEDDLGITQMQLSAALEDDLPTVTVPLEPVMSMVSAEGGDRVHSGKFIATAALRFDFASLSPQPGDILNVAVNTTDNRPVESGGQQRTNSSPLRIRIISESEWEAMIFEDLVRAETSLRQWVLEQADILDRTDRVYRDWTNHEDTHDGPRYEAHSLAPLAALLSREALLKDRVARIARRLGDIASRIELHGGRLSEHRLPIDLLSKRMVVLTKAVLLEAIQALERAKVSPDVSQGVAALHDAIRHEELALAELRKMLTAFSNWGAFQTLVTRAWKLLDRQETLIDQTAKIGRSTVGQPINALDDDARNELARVHREQEQLVTDAQQMVDRLEEMGNQSKGDPSVVESAQEAARKARALELMRNLQEAVDAIADNRTSEARIHQNRAQKAIRSVVDALYGREDRRLEALRKNLGNLQEIIALLIEEQEILQGATQESSALADDSGEAMSDEPMLENEQRRLRHNTHSAGDELGDADPSMAATRLAHEASDYMFMAEQKLRDKHPVQALQPQAEALIALRDTWNRLEALDRQAMQEQLRRSLSQMRDRLTSILEGQKSVHAELVQLYHELFTGGSASSTSSKASSAESSKDVTPLNVSARKHFRACALLARQQDDVHLELRQALADLHQAVVFEWALQRVGEWMEQLVEAFEARRIYEDTVILSEDAVSELERLLRTLDEFDKLPFNAEFAEATAGGSGQQGSQQQGQLIPPLAEILLLKAMQVEINGRTKSFQQAVDMATADEKQLRELRRIGETQREVRRLAAKMIEQQRQR